MAMAKAPRKPSDKPTERKKVPQPHGGYLVPGAGGGPQPGSGRPTNAIRSSFRDIVEDGLPHLKDYATDSRTVEVGKECPGCGETVWVEKPATRPADQLKAIDIAARYGLDEKFDMALINELLAAAEEVIGDDEDLAQRIRKKWVPILAGKLMANG